MNPIDAVTLLLVVVAVILGLRSGAIPQLARARRARSPAGARRPVRDPLAEWTSARSTPACARSSCSVTLIGAVAIGELLGAGLGSSVTRPARQRPARGRRPDDRRGLRGRPGVAHRVARRQPPGRGPGPAPRRDGRRLDRGPDVDRDPAATDRDRRRARRLAGRHRPARRLHRLRAAARAAGRSSRRPAARAIAAVAEASTLKVSAATCGLSSVGTGFVVAYDYVVTNAHVVAGADSDGVRVTRAGRARPRCRAGALRPGPRRRGPPRRSPRRSAARFARTDPAAARRGCARLPGRRRAQDRAGGGLGPFPGDRPRHLRRLEGSARGARAAGTRSTAATAAVRSS